MRAALLLLIATIAIPQNGLSQTRSAEPPVHTGQVSFDPSDLSVSYELVVAHGVTAYETRIVWHFSDGQTITEAQNQDWFFPNGLSYIAAVVPVNPLSTQTLVSSTTSSPAHYVRKPSHSPSTTTPLIDVDVIVVAAILADGNAFGEAATVREIFRKRQMLKREYDYWAEVVAHVWHDGSAIATLRSIVPELQHPRPDALGESLRLAIKQGAEAMLFYAERDLGDAPRLLEALMTTFEQQRQLISAQTRAK